MSLAAPLMVIWHIIRGVSRDHGVWAGMAVPRSLHLECSRCAFKHSQQMMLCCNVQVEREKERQRMQLLQARQLAAQAEAAAAAARAAAAALSGLDAARGDDEPADAAQAGAVTDLAAAPDRKRRRSEPRLASADHVQSLGRRARMRTRPDGHDRGEVFSCTLDCFCLSPIKQRGGGSVLPCKLVLCACSDGGLRGTERKTGGREG